MPRNFPASLNDTNPIINDNQNIAVESGTNPIENEKGSETYKRSSATLETGNIGSESYEYTVSLRSKPQSNDSKSGISHYFSDYESPNKNLTEDTTHFFSEETKVKSPESEIKENPLPSTVSDPETLPLRGTSAALSIPIQNQMNDNASALSILGFRLFPSYLVNSQLKVESIQRFI
jgi:hypothetical protein